MKTIGFVDYYISEWHANNYPAWIEAANKTLGTDYCVAYAWAELDVSPVDGVSTDEWCDKFGVCRCGSIEELCSRSDVIFILAPSDPDKHLPYAKAVFPFGKRVYVDKTFAPDLATAKEIFSLAQAHNTPFFSTSALRYATELDELADATSLVITGGGGNWEEYAIHQVEMAVKLTGMHPHTVSQAKQGKQRVVLVNGTGRDGQDKKITFVYAPSMPFTLCAEDGDGKSRYKTVRSDFFAALLTDIVRFFENGLPPFDPKETLEVMALRDFILNAEK